MTSYSLKATSIPGTRLCIETVLKLFHPIQSNEVDETEDQDDEQEERADELPAHSPEQGGPRPNHLLHIITKPEYRSTDCIYEYPSKMHKYGQNWC